MGTSDSRGLSGGLESDQGCSGQVYMQTLCMLCGYHSFIYAVGERKGAGFTRRGNGSNPDKQWFLTAKSSGLTCIL